MCVLYMLYKMYIFIYINQNNTYICYIKHITCMCGYTCINYVCVCGM